MATRSLRAMEVDARCRIGGGHVGPARGLQRPGALPAQAMAAEAAQATGVAQLIGSRATMPPGGGESVGALGVGARPYGSGAVR